MNIDPITDRLDGVRAHGDTAMARCPAHQDKSPSLKITDAGDRVLLHCHAGCTTEDILAAVGMTWADVFEGEHTSQAITPSLRVEQRRKLVCRYHHALTVAAMDGPILPELLALRAQYGDEEFEQVLEEFADPCWLKQEKWQREYRRFSK